MPNTRKNIPYNETTKTNNIPRKILVLMIAKTSNPFESLTEKIWVKTITIATKTANASKEKTPIVVDIMKNQKENPAVTANDLNLGEESSILNRIDECNQSRLR